MIFQDPRAHINPVRTIGDFLVEALVERGDSQADATTVVTDLLRAVGITDPTGRLRQYPHELSGGLLQRVMIAAALAVTPKLLLADEPTTALDVTTQSDVMVNLDAQRRERGLAMLFVTHDLELAAAVCDRIAVMYAGFLVEDAPAGDIHRLRRHPYTAGLLASRPDPTAPRHRLVAIPGRPLSAFEVGAGCPFVARCAFAVERCRTERPALRDLDGGRVAVTAPRICATPSRRPPGTGHPVTDGAVLEVAGLRKVFRVRPSDTDAVPSAPGPTMLGHATRRRQPTTSLVAVDDVSFCIAPRQSLAVVGESGSGKTTVARMIIGLEKPTSGRIIVNGRERPWRHVSSRERRRRAREAQIVFQDPYSSLDPRMTVRDCLDEVLRLHFDWERERRLARVEELLGQVGLDRRQADALPRALSGGQRQRVAIARALASEPRVLICDEAVASLDVSIQAQVLNLLSDIRDETGVSYLFISHDLAVVRQVSDEVVVMRHGRVVEAGPTERVLSEPDDPYTQRLLAAIPRPGWKPTHSSAGPAKEA